MSEIEWRNFFREFVDWCEREKGLSIEDLRARWRERVLELLAAGEISEEKARGRFESHTNISGWAGTNGSHRRIGVDNYFIFEDPLVAEFNRGRAKGDQLTVLNYTKNTPPSTQHAAKPAPRKRKPAPRVAHRRVR